MLYTFAEFKIKPLVARDEIWIVLLQTSFLPTNGQALYQHKSAEACATVGLFSYRLQQFSEHGEFVAGMWKMYTKSEDNLESEHLRKIFLDNHICIPGRHPGNFSKFWEFGKTRTLNPWSPPLPFLLLWSHLASPPLDMCFLVLQHFYFSIGLCLCGCMYESINKTTKIL